MDQIESDYCVVGAGCAGATAALRIFQAGHTVALLEARDRVGGRVWTQERSGIPIDYGGQWLGSGQERAYSLLKELGIQTYPTWTKGHNVFVISGKVRKYQGEIVIPKGGPISLLNLGLVLRQFAKWSGEVPLEAPWTAKRAKEWDSMTVATWINTSAKSATARKMLAALMSGIYTSDPGEVSMLFALFHAKSCGGINATLSAEIQSDRILGGAQLIPEKIAEKLGSSVHLNSPVKRIGQDAKNVVVSSNAVTVRTKRVIVAVPPSISSCITYEPVLPADRGMLVQRLPAGTAVKCAAIYNEPFWRGDGLSGQSIDLDSLVESTYDGSPPSGLGTLNAFAVGHKARELARLSSADRKSAFIRQLVKIFGPKASTPVDFVDHNWGEEEWTRGCYMAHWPPGVITEYGSALWDPIGRIHWAGTETSTAFNGAIEGAVRSGERAASEVMKADA
jgi:monoamine oxidase